MNEQMNIFDFLRKPDSPSKEESEINLIHGNCYEELKNMADDSVDLVVIDPPYEFIDATGGGTYGNKRGIAGLKNDYHEDYSKVYHEKTELGKRKKRGLNELTPICNGFDFSVFDELCRILKKVNIYVWCSKGQVGKILTYFENKGCFIDILTWHKSNPIPTCNGTYLNDTEYCIFAREKGVKVYGTFLTKFKYYVTPTNQQEKKQYGHPTIKPLHIIENLIVNSSQENETVLDCFMGSGTTGVACKKLKRKFIGIEISNQYFETAKKRILGTSLVESEHG